MSMILKNMSLLLLILLSTTIPHVMMMANNTEEKVGAGNPILFGAFIDGSSPASNFEADANRKVSIVLSYVDWDGNALDVNYLEQNRQNGKMSMITWQPSLGQNTLSQILGGGWDYYIIAWAQASAKWGNPWFLRFAHEMNGNWYSWSEGTNGNTAGQYVQAWIHVYKIFQQYAPNMVTFVWCPNVVFSGTTALTELYPGDQYVDWLGMDGYNWGAQGGNNWASFSAVFGQTYGQLASISSKPIIVGEMASSETGGDKGAWITDAYNSIIKDYPQIHGVNWFNINKEQPWYIESSQGAKAAFAAVINNGIYTSNWYSSLPPGKIYAPTP